MTSITPNELELWSRKIISATLDGKRAEDSRVELKANWIDPVDAAKRLAGHANAARGDNILWIFGIDENRRRLISVDPFEKGDWYRAIEKRFDGYPPRLLADVNFEVENSGLVSLYFDTQHEPPYVIKGEKGGFPEYIVPWRVGTALRAASRAQMLSLLIPTRSLSEFKREIEYNLTVSVASTSVGGLFRTDYFSHALGSGLFETLSPELRTQILETYAKIDVSNQRTIGYYNFSGNWHARDGLRGEVMRFFHEASEAITILCEMFNSADLPLT